MKIKRAKKTILAVFTIANKCLRHQITRAPTRFTDRHLHPQVV